jgi:hypothetical protein
MSRILKIAASLAVLASLTACTVIPPQVAYTGPAVGVVTVGPAPYYVAPSGPYYARPPYHAQPPYRGYHGYRHGHRHW